MIYEVKIREIELCGCGNEGNMVIELNGNLFKVYYQMPNYFIEEYLLNKLDWDQEDSLVYKIKGSDNCKMLIDLWLVYGYCKLTENKNKLFPIDINKCGGLCKGEIISINQNNELRMDCGILIDVDNEKELNDKYKIGDHVEVTGTYQIYLPNTEYDR